ncbi:hypothetical protein [Sorangium sp. So ce1099]|uniref:hypothetical protein n=1 Tax=Sorangium sp. So ce1099 TaxID=3133331 RepID=UPI003F5FF6BF
MLLTTASARAFRPSLDDEPSGATGATSAAAPRVSPRPGDVTASCAAAAVAGARAATAPSRDSWSGEGGTAETTAPVSRTSAH